jgi:hypothetical protein
VLVIADDSNCNNPLIRPALYRQMVNGFHRSCIETIRHTARRSTCTARDRGYGG